MDFPSRVLEVVRSVAGDNAVLHEPEISGNEWLYVKDCLDTGWVSTAGTYVARFEEELATFIGAQHAIATINGTAALHISLLLAGIKSGDEVLIPALTFVATANAVVYCGAYPHFVDSDEITLGIDVDKLRLHLSEIAKKTEEGCINRVTGRRIGALVCMHTFGHASNLDGLLGVCEEWQLPLIEDAAESLGTYYKDLHTGNYGKLAAFSFNGNKTVTTGSGGAIVTNDEDLAQAARHLTTTAKIPHRWAYEHDEIGFNYRLANINAAVGCAQLERVNDFLHRKRLLAYRFREAFAALDGVSFFSEPKHSKSNYWLNAILLDKEYVDHRDTVLQTLNEAGLMVRPIWKPLDKLPIYASCPAGDLVVSHDLAHRIINIPSSPILADRI